MSICSQCGAQLRPSAKLCVKCGTPVTPNSAPAISSPKPAPTPVSPATGAVPLARQEPAGIPPLPGRNEAPVAPVPGGATTSTAPPSVDVPARGVPGDAPGVASPAPAADAGAVAMLRTVTRAASDRLPGEAKEAITKSAKQWVLKALLVKGGMVLGVLALIGLAAFYLTRPSSPETVSRSGGASPQQPRSKAGSPAEVPPSSSAGSVMGVPTQPGPGAAPPQTAGSVASLPRSAEPLQALLASARARDWREVGELTGRIASEAPARSHGDRKAARAANVEGLKALQAGDFSAALSSLERAVDADSGDIEIRNNLAYACIQAGQLDRGLRELATLLLNKPDRSSAWANYSEASARQGREDVAIDALRLVVYNSSNRQKTIDYLQSVVTKPEPKAYVSAAKSVLDEIDSVPTVGPRDIAQGSGVPASGAGQGAIPASKATSGNEAAGGRRKSAAELQKEIDDELRGIRRN